MMLMYEFEAIALVAFLFILTYLLGSLRNRRLAVKYAKLIREQMSPYCSRVGFRRLGLTGFRVLCQPKDVERRFEKIEMAVSLVDRENLMHYPLSLFTREHDRLVCWLFPRNEVPFDLDVLSLAEKKLHRKLLGMNTLKEVQGDQADLQGFFPPLASDVRAAKRFLSHQEVRESLVKASNVLRLLSLSHSESRIHLVGKASRESIELLLNLALSCGGRFG